MKSLKLALVFINMVAFHSFTFSQLWEVPLFEERYYYLSQNISIDNGDGMLGVGSSWLPNQNNETDNGFVIKVNKDGSYIFREIQIEDNSLIYYTATQLDNGNFMVLGLYDDSLNWADFTRYVRVNVFDENLEVVSEKNYRLDYGECLGTQRSIISSAALQCAKKQNGNVVIVAPLVFPSQQPNGAVYQSFFCFYELDTFGDSIRAKMQPEYIGEKKQAGNAILRIIPKPNSDSFMFLGDGNYDEYLNCYGVWNLDSDLNITTKTPILNDGPFTCVTWTGCGDHWFDDYRFVAYVQNYPQDTQSKRPDDIGTMYFMDTLANTYTELRLPPTDSCTLAASPQCNIAYANDTTIYVFSYSSSEYWDLNNYQFNIMVIDKDFNILGRKVIRKDGWRVYPTYPVTFNDGNCAVPAIIEKNDYSEHERYLWCFSRDEIEMPLTVEETEGLNVAVAYPNPTSAIIHIPFERCGSIPIRIQVYDAKGLKCLDRAINEEGNLITINAQNLETGVYAYRIVSGSDVLVSGKFIKQ